MYNVATFSNNHLMRTLALTNGFKWADSLIMKKAKYSIRVIEEFLKQGQSGSLKAFVAEMTAFFIGNDCEDKFFFRSGRKFAIFIVCSFAGVALFVMLYIFVLVIIGPPI
ncbi:hypothetical protein ES703_73255 [subsurface metagenome]